MSIDPLIKFFSTALGEGNYDIKEDSKFRDAVPWDSLGFLMLVAEVEMLYQVLLNAEDVRNSQTVGDLFEIIKKKKG